MRQPKPEEFVFLSTAKGKAIKFRSIDVRPMGRAAGGVRGIKLAKGDSLVDMTILPEHPQLYLLSVCQLGFGKRTPTTDYPIRTRGGQGIIAYNVSKKTGNVVACLAVVEDSEIMVMTGHGKTIRLAVSDIRVAGRATSGVKLIDLSDGDQIKAVVRVPETKVKK